MVTKGGAEGAVVRKASGFSASPSMFTIYTTLVFGDEVVLMVMKAVVMVVVVKLLVVVVVL